MKANYIILTVLCLTMTNAAEAQFLKKLKKKAEQAAERTVLNKTDEIVTEKTEKTIDGIASGDDKNSDSTNSTSNSNNTTLNTRDNASFSSNNPNASKLLDNYEFNWEFKTTITSGKNDSTEINYLINSNSSDYFGMELSNEDLKGQGKMYMVMDNMQKTNIMFMDMNGQKMGQIHKMPDLKESKDKANMSFKEIGTKEILGYTCYGMEVEDQTYIGDLYFTLDAPVNFSAFFAMANNKNAPKGFDPALLQVLKEDALLMEMTMTNKSKSKETYKMTAVSLEKKNLNLIKKDYQFMNLGGF